MDTLTEIRLEKIFSSCRADVDFLQFVVEKERCSVAVISAAVIEAELLAKKLENIRYLLEKEDATHEI